MKTKLALIITLAGCFLCGNIFADPPLPGAIFTTDSTCSGVDLNIYGAKTEVYLNGGPAHPGAASLPDGSYYVRVTNPSGSLLLGTSIGSGNDTPFVVSGGIVQGCYQLSAILIKGSDATPGYDDTDNPGGEYKVWVSKESSFTNNSTKTDNFKVKENPVVATLCIDKFYDANVNGIKDNGEVSINGWLFTIVADNNLFNQRFTSPLCIVTEAGLYHIFESEAIETNWVHTTPITNDAAIPLTPNLPVEFGNVCLGAGGGLTLGFWSNKNGQNLENAADFTFLTGLCLRNATGGNQDFGTNLAQNKSALHDWLLNASATNMANMLSAQLAAMELNVRHPGVTGTALVYGGDCVKAYQQSQQLPGSNGFITINDLMTAANTELCAHPLTLSGSPFRAFQECMKTTLDQANNNINFVQGSPCPFTFSGVAP